MAPEEVVHGAVDEVDDLDRRVDDAERLHRVRERPPEELLVQPGNYALTAFGVVDAADHLLDVVVEVLKGRGLGPESAGVERLDHRLHDLRHRVAPGELAAAEQGVEDRPRDQVLGEHLDGVVRGHGIVEVVPERGQELVEAGDGVRVLPGVLDQAPDPGFLGGRDLGDVFGPVLHVAAVADLLDDPRIESVAPLTQIGERELPGVEVIRCGRDPGLVGAVAAVQPDPG